MEENQPGREFKFLNQTPGMDAEKQKKQLKALLSQDYNTVDTSMLATDPSSVVVSDENKEEENGMGGKEYVPPSKEEAVKHQSMWLFKDFERDGNGLPIGEGYPFHFFSGSRDIGLESEGLALAIGPMVVNLSNVHFDDNYRFSQYGSVDEITETCPKNFSSTAGFASNSSIGAFCPDNRFSNPFDCPAICQWNVTRAKYMSECQTVNFDSFLNASCNLHLPCSTRSRAIAKDRPQDSAGLCLCCDLELDDTKDGKSPVWQIYIYLFGIFVFLAGVDMLQGLSELYARQIDASQCTSADYSILISELGFGNQISKDDLANFCTHYGEVVHVARIKKVGLIVTKSRELTQLLLQQQEVAAQVKHPAEYHCGCGIFYWMFLKLYASNKPQALEAINKKIEKIQAEIDELELNQLENTDRAIVIMNYRDHTENIIRDFTRTFYQEVKRNLTVGRMDDCPKLKNRTLVVTRAPEPTDLWWQHTHYVGHLGRRRRVISAFVMVLSLLVAVVIQAWFAAMAANQRQERMEEIASGQTVSFSRNIELSSLSYVYGLVVTVLNIVVSYLISFLTSYEMWSTRSAHEKWHVLKLSIFYILNSAVVPALAPIIWDSISSNDEEFGLKSSQNFYTSGGVISQAFSIQLSNAVVADLLTLFSPTFILFNKILPRFAKTQDMLNQMIKPPDFPLAERFSSAVKTVALAMFYGPALPVSYPIALFGLIFSYWTDKYVALRRCKKPQALNAEVDDTILFVLRLLPVLQILMMGLVYFEDTGVHKTITLVVGFAIWAAFIFTPFGLFLGLRKELEDHDHGGTRDQPYLETLGKQGELINHDQDDVELSNAQSSAIVNNYHRRKQEKEVRIVLVRRFMYKPRVRRTTEEFAQKLSELYDVPNYALSPNLTLLQGQKKENGGFAARAPEPQYGNINFGLPDDSPPVIHHGGGGGPPSFASAVQKVKDRKLFQQGRYPSIKRHAGDATTTQQNMSPYLPMVLYKSGGHPTAQLNEDQNISQTSSNPPGTQTRYPRI